MQIIPDVKIAIAYCDNRISPVFDESERVCLIDVENGKEMRREDGVLGSHDPFNRARELSRLGAKVLICGAISHDLERAIIDAGVRVIGFICGDMNAVKDAYLGGRLGDGRFFMPGIRGERRRHRNRGRHGRDKEQCGMDQ